jgi:hypothetical protein
MASEQLERSQKDDEEATAMRKELDELLQRDVMAHQRILELLDEVRILPHDKGLDFKVLLIQLGRREYLLFRCIIWSQ